MKWWKRKGHAIDKATTGKDGRGQKKEEADWET